MRTTWLAPLFGSIAVAVVGACLGQSVDSGGVDASTVDAATAESGCPCTVPTDRPWDRDAIVNACRAEATSWCGALERCAPDQLTGEFGTLDYCLTRRALQCEVRWAPGIGDSPERVQACADEVAKSSCDALFCQGLPASCTTVPGLHPAGAPCRVHEQCASRSCEGAAPATCGACAPAPPSLAGLGEDCSARPCGPGLLCNENIDPDAGALQCIPRPPAGLGQSCEGDPCEPGRVCARVAASALGQAPSGFCADSGAPSCTAPAPKWTSGMCGGMSTVKFCEHGVCATWGTGPGGWMTACLPPVPDGDICEVGSCRTWPYCEPFRRCESPAVCTPNRLDAATGHCKIVDLRTCP